MSKTGDPDTKKLQRAWRLVRRRSPELECFPDVQADVALNPDQYRDSAFGKFLPLLPANILIYPNLHAANSAYRLAKAIGGGVSIGPMLLGLRRPCNVLPRGSTEDEIIDMMAVTAYNAQRRKGEIESGKFTRVMRQ
jgi:malate dehydrogenase (oxaloacetate-decarboxylating)(NADP+)